MSKVTSLVDRLPGLHGPAECLACKHQWKAYAPDGTVDALECPKCLLHRGVMQGNVFPQEGEEVYVCGCGSHYFFLKPDGAICHGCGLKTPFGRLS